MTSANLSEEPIITENEDALTKLAPIADAFLLHNRPIHLPCDDSVLRPEMPIRRSRRYAPFPVKLPFALPPILGVGGVLKNTFCLAQDKHAFMSQHIGDMENVETYESFEKSVQHLEHLFRVTPENVAYDLHPGYFSTRYAETREKHEENSVRLIAVQHHHAHIAACMADNGLENKKVIGLAFDGTGYGTDAPAASVPNSQITALSSTAQVPSVVVAATSRRLDDSTFVSRTSVAAAGPVVEIVSA